MCHMSGTMPSGFLVKFYPILTLTLVCRSNNKEVRIFSLSLAILANKRALREGLRAGTTHIPVCMTLPHIYKVINAVNWIFRTKFYLTTLIGSVVHSDSIMGYFSQNFDIFDGAYLGHFWVFLRALKG